MRRSICVPATNLMFRLLFTKTVNGGGTAKPQESVNPSYPTAPAEFSFNRSGPSIFPFSVAVATAADERSPEPEPLTGLDVIFCSFVCNLA